MNDEKLSESQAISMIINLVCNKLFILAPLYFKQQSGFSAFIITTVVFSAMLVLWNIYCKINLKSLSKLISNKTTNSLVIIILVFVSALILSATINQYSYELKESVLSKTPVWLISFVFLSITLYSTKHKLKHIGSVCSIFVPAIYIVALILVTISVNSNDLYNLFPAIDTNYNTIIKKVLLMLAMLFEMIFLYFLPDVLRNKSYTQKTGNKIIFRCYTNYLIISVIFSIILPTTSNAVSTPFFHIIKQAHVYNKYIKPDSLFLIMYCLSAYSYISSMILFVFEIIKINFSNTQTIIIKIILVTLIIFATLNLTLNKQIYAIIGRHYFILSAITFGIPSILLLANKVLKCKSKS